MTTKWSRTEEALARMTPKERAAHEENRRRLLAAINAVVDEATDQTGNPQLKSTSAEIARLGRGETH